MKKCKHVLYVVQNYVQSVHKTHTHKRHNHHMAWLMTLKHGETHIQTFIHAWSSSDACAVSHTQILWWAILPWMKIKQRLFLENTILKKKVPRNLLYIWYKRSVVQNMSTKVGVNIQGVDCISTIPIQQQKHHK